MKYLYLKILIIAALISLACTTKVSEWVLLNAPADNYLLVYFHPNPLTESEKIEHVELETRLKTANVVLKIQINDKIESPFYSLYFNNRLIFEELAYQDLRSMEISPLRKKIADDLMSGKLTVMLFLTSGNPEKDQRGLEVLKKSIASSPFRDIITVQELNRNSLEERELVSMLLNVESDLKYIHEPMLFGIFGRFRALEPLLAKGISEENIHLMIDFLTADCSCLIKDNLPGRSILYNGKWANPTPALVNKILDENPDLIHN